MDSIGSPALWAGFVGFVLVMLALDLGVFHRKAHVVGFREAAIWSGVWVGLSMVFAAGLWGFFGGETATLFLTGYLLEKSLSVDNVFVFVVIFGALSIPAAYQHRVLFWGILSALILRALMIFAGAAMLERFEWLIYVFGAFLVFTGVKLFRSWKKGSDGGAITDNAILRWITRRLPSTPNFHGHHFFTVENGKRLATPLLTALVLVELTDVVFALDSIPAIFAITRDPFIVFTSNIFAILGLRSLYFLLAGMMDRFAYLEVGLSGVLVFVGLKMALVDVFHVPPVASFGVIVVLLGGSIGFSLARKPEPADDEDRGRAADG